MSYELVVIGTSWGGLNAIRRVLKSLPADFDLPIVIVQHRHRDSSDMLVALLQDHTEFPVAEVEDKAELKPGCIYIAPADYHVLVEGGHLALSTEEPFRYSRPSIDVTFESAADVYGRKTLGVVMTGANDDGARGLKRIADRGGRAIVQDPRTAESPVMPNAAIRMVPDADIVSLDELGEYICAVTSRASVARPRAIERRDDRNAAPRAG